MILIDRKSEINITIDPIRAIIKQQRFNSVRFVLQKNRDRIDPYKLTIVTQPKTLWER